MVGYFLVNRSATWSMIVCSFNAITATGSHAFTPKSNVVHQVEPGSRRHGVRLESHSSA